MGIPLQTFRSSDSPLVTELTFLQPRGSGGRILRLTIMEGDKTTRLVMTNPYPTEDVFEIVEAEHILIEDDRNSQRDYGRFKVEYGEQDMLLTEFWVDSIENVKE